MSPLPRRVSFDPVRYRPRGWAEKHQFAVSFAIFVGGVAAFKAAKMFNVTGWAAFILLGFAALAVYPWRGFLREPARTFPLRQTDGPNSWKYFVYLGILWLIILPIAAWLAVHALGK
jgi:hypothetical protein